MNGGLGYADAGRHDKEGRPFIDAHPRSGIYRDVLPGTVQAIEFADLVFWHADQSGQLAWGLLAQAEWVAVEHHR